jgi:SAM-dependent methyltransferase
MKKQIKLTVHHHLGDFVSSNTPEQEKYLPFLDYASSFRMKLIREFLGDIDRKTVVDIGSGSGSISYLLWFLGARVYSVDISSTALQATRNLTSLSKVSAQFEPGLCRGDAMRLPFRGEIFDIVLCLETLEHLPDDRSAIKEIARVMNPGGTVILSVPYDSRVNDEEILLGHYRRYSFKTLKERLYSGQLRLERIVFWCFPMLELLDLVRVRYVFASLGLLIESFSNGFSSFRKFRNLRSHDAFVHSLVRFYRTKLWLKVVLPFLTYVLDLNKMFQNLPYSKDVFLIFRKVP